MSLEEIGKTGTKILLVDAETAAMRQLEQARKTNVVFFLCVDVTLHELGEVNDRVIFFAVVIVVRAHTVAWLIDFGQKNAE